MGAAAGVAGVARAAVAAAAGGGTTRSGTVVGVGGAGVGARETGRGVTAGRACHGRCQARTTARMTARLRGSSRRVRAEGRGGRDSLMGAPGRYRFGDASRSAFFLL